jgi:predicted transcriptional regulator
MKKMPETSIESYRSLDPRQLNETYRQILYALDEIGEGTFEDIASFLKCNAGKIWKRMSELGKMELAYRPGNKRKLKSGKMGFTWMKTSPSRTKEEKQSLETFFQSYQEEPPVEPVTVQTKLHF